MKGLFIVLIIGLLLAAGAGYVIQGDPGYVRITHGNWILESNLLVFIFLLLVFYGAIALFVALVKRLKTSKRVIGDFLGGSRQRKASEQTNAGLLAFLEGNWSESLKLLKRSASHSDMPIVNYLAAAHAANETGKLNEAEAMLQKAYEHTSDKDFAIGIAKAQMELDQNQLESCLATLVRLKAQKPQHPFVLKLLKTVYLRLGDWRQVLQLIPELRKQSNADKEKLDALEEEAWSKLFSQKADELMRLNEFDRASSVLADLWKQLPDSIRFDEHIIVAYARQLIRLKNPHEAETLLRKMLTKTWSDELVGLYGSIEGRDTAEQLLAAEKWLKERPNNAALLLALGRLSLRNELWGKAHEYFLASNRLHGSEESFAELCRLEKNLHDDAKELHVQGLIDSLDLPELPMPKRR